VAQLAIRLLGGFAVTLDGEPVTGFDSNKVRALLAYLAVEANRAHRRESLATLLWPGYPERSARTNLRNALANLRTAIGDREAQPPHLLATRDTLQFNAASDHQMDVAAVEQAAASPRTLTADKLVAAAEAYSGDFLAGFTLADAVAFDDWASATRERVRGQAFDLLGEVVERLEADGDPERAIDYARRRVALSPWQEAAHRDLIRLLAETGQRSAALRQYRACVRALEEELGAEPSEETVSLAEGLQAAGHAAGSRANSEPGLVHEPPAAPPHSLPSVALPIVGREELLTEIGDYLHDPTRRLVTLVGPGGSGKTRLALEVGRSMLSRYPDGVFFVSLAEVQRPSGVWSAMAKSLGFAPAGAQPGHAQEPLSEQLTAYLREKHMLLIVDNAEHLLGVDGDDGLREAVKRLLSTAPSVTSLVTSRERLHLLQEQIVRIAGIAFESGGVEGVAPALTPAAELFAAVASRTSPGFAVTSSNRAAVDAVCRAVQGFPLALLLAASWVDVLTPEEIAEQLAGAEPYGVDVLTTDWVDVPERHRSLIAVFDGSWDRLTPEQREAFAALSVFRGSFTWRSAGAVGGASLPVLRSLVARSLLAADGDRYRMHPLLREVAALRLAASGMQDLVAARHSRYYSNWVARSWDKLRGAERAKALVEIESEIGDALQAWEWAADRGDVDVLLTMLEGLREYLDWRQRSTDAQPGIQLAIDRLIKVNSSSGGLTGRGRVLLAYLYGWWGWFTDSAGIYSERVQLGVSVLIPEQKRTREWRRCRAWLAFQSAHAASWRGDQDLALARVQAAYDGYAAAGDAWWQARMLGVMGDFARRKGDLGTAAAYFSEASRLFRAVGDGIWETGCLLELGRVHMGSGDLVQAGECLRQGVADSQRIGDPRLALAARIYLAMLALRRGEYAAGETDLAEAQSACRELGLPVKAVRTTAAIALARLQQGDYATACERAEEGLARAEAGGAAIWASVVAPCCCAWGQALLALGDVDRAADLLERSVELYTMAADERADSQAILAIARLQQGGTGPALYLVQTALGLFVDSGTPGVAEYPLTATALLLAEAGMADTSVTLYAAAARLPLVANGQWFADVVERPLRAAARKTLTPEQYAAAEDRGHQLTAAAALNLAREALSKVAAPDGDLDD